MTRRFGSACVASPHYLASGAGLAVLQSGGNALDAAIAVNLTLGVVAPYTCGPGGDLFAIVWDGSSLHAYNGSGRAPQAATPDAIGAVRMPVHGPHPVTVPGAVEAWFTILERFGTRSFEELARAAVAYAADGFPLTVHGAGLIRRAGGPYEGPGFEEWRRLYADPGDRLVQTELARTLVTLGSRGPNAFYGGEIGEAIASCLPLMSGDDLAAHRGDWVAPLSTTFRGMEVHELPPNTQGVAALEMLNIAEGLDLDSPARDHGLVEAVKLALTDRDQYVSDPAWMRVPAESIASKAWADARRREIDPATARTPAPARAPDGGTAYMCAADSGGMCVSLIQSNFGEFGSGVVVPGWGINLHNRGSSFSLDPSHVNAIAPRKRPMHTLIPGMALRGGRPSLVFGTRSGHSQAQVHLQLLVRLLADGLDLQQSVDAPRWVVSPTTVALESRFPDEAVRGLESRGHRVRVTAPYEWAMGYANAIAVEPGGYACASDSRTEGAALGL